MYPQPTHCVFHEMGVEPDRYQGCLLHELICAGGSKWLDGRDRKSPRLTHGSQRLLMPEEAGRWDKSPPCEDCDENEEEHYAWNRGLGLFTLQGSSPRTQQCPKEEKLCKTAFTCRFALHVLYVSMEWRPTTKQGEHEIGQTLLDEGHCKTYETCQGRGRLVLHRAHRARQADTSYDRSETRQSSRC